MNIDDLKTFYQKLEGFTPSTPLEHFEHSVAHLSLQKYFEEGDGGSELDAVLEHHFRNGRRYVPVNLADDSVDLPFEFKRFISESFLKSEQPLITLCLEIMSNKLESV